MFKNVTLEAHSHPTLNTDRDPFVRSRRSFHPSVSLSPLSLRIQSASTQRHRTPLGGVTGGSQVRSQVQAWIIKWRCRFPLLATKAHGRSYAGMHRGVSSYEAMDAIGKALKGERTGEIYWISAVICNIDRRDQCRFSLLQWKKSELPKTPTQPSAESWP